MNINQITNITAQNNGGVIYSDNTRAILNLNADIRVKEASAMKSGGVVYINEAKSILMEGNAYNYFYANVSGSILHTISTGVVITIKTNFFHMYPLLPKYQETFVFDNIKEKIYFNSQMFYIKDASTKVQSSSNEFKYNLIANKGSIFYLQNSELLDATSKYSDNAALYGTIVYCIQCSIELDTIEIKNSRAYQGGLFYIEELKTTPETFLYNVNVNDIKSYGNGGGIVLLGSTAQTIHLNTVVVQTTESNAGQGGFMYVKNSVQDIQITDLKLYDAKSDGEGGVFMFEDVNTVTIGKNTTTNSVSEFHRIGPVSTSNRSFGSFMYSICTTLDLTITDTILKCKDIAFIYATDLQIQIESPNPVGGLKGAFFIANATSDIVSQRNSFSNCYLTDDASIFNIGKATLKDTDSTYNYCAGVNGGVISSQYVSVIEINGQAPTITFQNIYAQRGGAFYLEDDCHIKISSVSFQDIEAIYDGGFMQHLERLGTSISATTKIEVHSSSITNVKARLSGGVFYINNSLLTEIVIDQQSSFSNIQALQGNGGIFMIEDMGGKLTLTQSTITDFYAINDPSGQQFNGSLIFSEDSNFELDISSNTIQCRTTYDKDQAYTKVSTLSSSYAGAIYVKNSIPGITSASNDFKYCTDTFMGSAFHIIGTTLTDTGSRITQGAAIYGGGIFTEKSTITLTSTKIDNHFAFNGGAILFDNQNTATFSQAQFFDNNATWQGGAFVIQYSEANNPSATTISISDTIEIHDNKATQGGLAYIDNERATLTIFDCAIRNHTALAHGGLLHIINAEKISITKGQIRQLEAKKNSHGIYSIARGVTIEIIDSQILCQDVLDYKYLSTLLNETTSIFTSRFSNFISGAKLVDLKFNTYRQCFISQYGGIWRFEDTEYVSEFQSEYYDNLAVRGGAISLSNSSVQINETTLKNHNATIGGVFHAEKKSYLNVFQCKVESNVAFDQGGVFYVNTESVLVVNGSELYYNYAQDSSVVFSQGTDRYNNVTLLDSRMNDNTAVKNTVSLLKVQSYIENVEFSRNVATEQTKNLFISESNVIMREGIFRETKYKNPEEIAAQVNTTGTFIIVSMNSSVDITQTKFYDGISYAGGAIYLQSQSSLTVSYSDFYSNYAFIYGGAIFASNFVKLIVDDRTKMINNKALDKGDDIFAFSTEGTLIFDSVSLTNPTAVSSIYAEAINLIIKTTIFQNINQRFSYQGGAVQCINCESILIEDCKFQYIESEMGGAIYIIERNVNKYQGAPSNKYHIKSSTFISNKANVAGAIYIDNAQRTVIEDCYFYKNEVHTSTKQQFKNIGGSGGSIYYTCDRNDLDCRLEIGGRTLFQENYGFKQGGAIFWDVNAPILNDTIEFYENSAVFYGDDVASYSIKLVIIERELYEAQLQRITRALWISNSTLDPTDFRRRLQLFSNVTDETKARNYSNNPLTENVNGHVSGTQLPDFYLAYVDYYGQIVGSDLTSSIRLEIDAEFNVNDTYAKKYIPYIWGETNYNSYGGVAKVSGVSFTGTPGSEFKIAFKGSAIDEELPVTEEYKVSNQIQSIESSMFVDIRECEVGEFFSEDGQCIMCPNGTGYLLEKQDEPGSCLPCPDEGNCVDGNRMGPAPGYWRSNNDTLYFLKCMYPPSCLGMIAPNYNPQGDCEVGYQGLACSDCQRGYYRMPTYECRQCRSFGGNLALLIFLILIFIAFIWLLVYLQTTLAYQKVRKMHVYMRILVDHLHLVIIIASFNFDWNQFIYNFYQGYGAFSEVLTFSYSIDCFYQDIGYGFDPGDNTNLRFFYWKILIYALIPLFILLVAALIWKISEKARRLKQYPWGYYITTIIIGLFLVQPNVIYYMLESFRCIDIESVQRLHADYEIKCWTESHSIWAFFISLPSSIVWGLVSPFLCFAIMSKLYRDKALNHYRSHLGFLTNGFKDKFYYWEIIIIYKKLILIFISSFAGHLGKVTQGLVFFIIIICFLLATFKLKPYSRKGFINLECLSLVVTLCTVYFAIFFVSDVTDFQDETGVTPYMWKANKHSKNFFFLLILVANLIFMIYWIYLMALDIRAILRVSNERLYTYFCAFKNKRRVENEQALQGVQEQNEALRDEFMASIKKLQKFCKSGKITLDVNNFLTFKKYISSEKVLEAMIQQSNLEYERQLQDQRMNKLTEVARLIKQNEKVREEFDITKYEEEENVQPGKSAKHKKNAFFFPQEFSDSSQQDSFENSFDNKKLKKITKELEHARLRQGSKEESKRNSPFKDTSLPKREQISQQSLRKKQGAGQQKYEATTESKIFRDFSEEESGSFKLLSSEASKSKQKTAKETEQQKKDREKQEKLQKEEEEQKKKKEEEEQKKKQKEEEALKIKQKEEEERKKKEDEERKKKEEEDMRIREEQEKIQKEADEKQRKIDEERRKKEEEERIKREKLEKMMQKLQKEAEVSKQAQKLHQEGETIEPKKIVKEELKKSDQVAEERLKREQQEKEQREQKEKERQQKREEERQARLQDEKMQQIKKVQEQELNKIKRYEEQKKNEEDEEERRIQREKDKRKAALQKLQEEEEKLQREEEEDQRRHVFGGQRRRSQDEDVKLQKKWEEQEKQREAEEIKFRERQKMYQQEELDLDEDEDIVRIPSNSKLEMQRSLKKKQTKKKNSKSRVVNLGGGAGRKGGDNPFELPKRKKEIPKSKKFLNKSDQKMKERKQAYGESQVAYNEDLMIEDYGGKIPSKAQKKITFMDDDPFRVSALGFNDLAGGYNKDEDPYKDNQNVHGKKKNLRIGTEESLQDSMGNPGGDSMISESIDNLDEDSENEEPQIQGDQESPYKSYGLNK